MTEFEQTQPTEETRYASLQDYMRVVRRHRLLVVGTMLAFAIAAYVLSVTQTPKYLSQVSMSFRDPVQEGALFGENVIPTQAPAERAAANGELAGSEQIAARVRKDLKSSLTPRELASRVTTQVDIRTNLLELTAEASEARQAADIANSFAEQVVNLRTKQAQRAVDDAEEAVRRELQQIRKEPPSFTKETGLALASQRLQRLETLRDIATPATINERATPSAEPTSPKPARNAVIGIIVGLIFGLMGAFVRSSLDRRIHNAREASDELGVAVLGRVPRSALGLPGLAKGPGRTSPMPEFDFESFRMLRMNLSFLAGEGNRIRNVLVTSGAAEEGKSTVSMGLASAAALAGHRVLLVECDLRRPTFAQRLDVQATPGLTDYLEEKATPKEILQVVDVHEPTPTSELASKAKDRPERTTPNNGANMVCITAGSPSQIPSELLVGERFTSFLDKVSKAYDLVVIDSSPLLAVVDPLELMPRVDAVLVCVRVQQTSRDELRAVRTALENVPDRSVGAVATGFKRGDPDSYDYYYGY